MRERLKKLSVAHEAAKEFLSVKEKRAYKDFDRKEVEKKIYGDLAQELEGFDWGMAMFLLGKYLKKCNFIAHLVFLKYQAGLSSVP